MYDVMDKAKVRMVLVVEDEIRATLRLAAAQGDEDMADVVDRLVREHLPDVLTEVRQRREAKERPPDDPPPTPRPKKGGGRA